MNIRPVGLLAGIVSLTVVMTAGNAAAQGSPRGALGPMHYDTAAETTVVGTVEEVDLGRGQGTHVLLKTADGTLTLALGPSWYQTDKKYELSRGDQLDVIGSRSTVRGSDVLVVREIKKGAATMIFRDAQGFPMWAGGRRR